MHFCFVNFKIIIINYLGAWHSVSGLGYSVYSASTSFLTLFSKFIWFSISLDNFSCSSAVTLDIFSKDGMLLSLLINHKINNHIY